MSKFFQSTQSLGELSPVYTTQTNPGRTRVSLTRGELGAKNPVPFTLKNNLNIFRFLKGIAK